MSSLYYLTALIAILGTVGYHSLLKRVSPDIDPLVSIFAIYLGILIIGAAAIPFFLNPHQIGASIRQLGWTQIGIALCILAMEFGFLLMYRSGWSLSSGNIFTSAIINITLAVLGMFFLSEKLSLLNVTGIVLSIMGVIMISYR